jgi:hydrogenase maturation protein HypF
MKKGGALLITAFGVVQGVGFRPFIYRLAHRHGFKGWVRNAGDGVNIHVEAEDKARLELFLRDMAREKPSLAVIERLTFKRTAVRGYKDFTVRTSGRGERFVFISPDISTCPACRRDIANPRDRRFRYPFTNCTDCGPRYTIVTSLPYDRPNTTMSGFPMCPECAAEYDNPFDRRYHAQPVACPACGPCLDLREAKGGKCLPGGIGRAVELIRGGKILAVKGLGGYHLVCDPLNAAAVGRLRKIKERTTKPLALMARDIETVERYARLSAAERDWLTSERRPIVLLKKKKDISGIAPHLGEIGFMLPYTPLHYLLLEDLKLIVATSSNRKDAPIMKDENEGAGRIADAVLSHNRPIAMRADDSVVKVVDAAPLFLRRARGYVPYPQKVRTDLQSKRDILALGAELKDTVSIYKNGYIVTSQFLGDLDEYQNHLYFEETIAHLTALFDVKPCCVVSDLHPDFHTTRFARKLGLPHIQVQHHHAHVLAALIEHGLPLETKVLGVSWDGYGYGPDGTAWGGEFLLADYIGFDRIAHFDPVPLPGGDLAAKQPWRMAVACLAKAGYSGRPGTGIPARVADEKVQGVRDMIAGNVRSPLSSSCGRLFDAVAALTGLAPLENEYEAEAAMRLEAAAAERIVSAYPFELIIGPGPVRISFDDMIRKIETEMSRGVAPSTISARFHNTLGRVILEVARMARERYGTRTVVLCGGVFLNKKLLHRATADLEEKGFRVLRPVHYSPNDESISVGQVAGALARLVSGRSIED